MKNKPHSFAGYIIPVRQGRAYALKSICFGMANPIGPRLQRAAPWPLDTDLFPNKKTAQAAADKLNHYLNATPPW